MSIELEIDGQLADSQQLSKLLERVAELQAEKERIAIEAKKVNKALDEAEQMAVEVLAASGLDGVRAAGKSWSTREFFSVSVPSENREAVVEAAEEAGLSDLIAVNTTTLKSWLVENRGDGQPAEAGLAAGTPFEGLIDEYREVRLSHRTLG
jgi:hypothetical protein